MKRRFFDLLLHELCHAVLQSNPLICSVMLTLNGSYLGGLGKVDPSTEFWKGQGYEEIIKHDAIPEEAICNAFVMALTGRPYSRAHWRKHIAEVDAST